MRYRLFRFVSFIFVQIKLYTTYRCRCWTGQRGTTAAQIYNDKNKSTSRNNRKTIAKSKIMTWQITMDDGDYKFSQISMLLEYHFSSFFHCSNYPIQVVSHWLVKNLLTSSMQNFKKERKPIRCTVLSTLIADVTTRLYSLLHKDSICRWINHYLHQEGYVFVVSLFVGLFTCNKYYSESYLWIFDNV